MTTITVGKETWNAKPTRRLGILARRPVCSSARGGCVGRSALFHFGVSMKTLADELREELRSLDAAIAANDTQIEDAERRQDLRRRHGDSLYRRRLQIVAQLERGEAPLVKPRGKCVTEIMPNGLRWDV